MITNYTFDSGVRGLRVLITGAVHGDEKCGSKAITRVIHELEQGTIQLKKGSVAFAPIVNQKAYDQNIRYVDENLNRVVTKTKSPTSYEQEVANSLCALIDSCDIMLDVHSFSAQGGAFAFLDHSVEQSVALIQVLHVPHVIEGWPDMYEDDPLTQSYDTERYAFSAGKACVTLECGSHEDKESVSVAYEAIISTLRYFNGISHSNVESSAISVYISMKQVFLRKSNSDTLAKKWTNFDPVKKGELIARYSDGTHVYSPLDGYVVLPTETGVTGEEFFYLGVDKKDEI